MKYFLFGALFCLFSSCGMTVVVGLANEPIKDYDVAIQTAQIEQKNVLLIFSLDNCKHCNILKKDLPTIKNANNYVVCVLDSRENKRLTGKMNIKKWPTSVIITVGKETQGESSRLVGYSDKSQYDMWLKSNAAVFGDDGVCGCDCSDDCSCRKDGICVCCGDKKCDCKK